MTDGPQKEDRELPGDSSPPSLPRGPPFLEVECQSSGKVRRFAAGTVAGYALYLINRKLEFGVPRALRIEAAKEGEEPVSFGPSAPLANYGEGWRLQTIVEEDYGDAGRIEPKQPPYPYEAVGAKPRVGNTSSKLSPAYMGKILLVFIFMFLLGTVLTLFLEALPSLLSAISPST